MDKPFDFTDEAGKYDRFEPKVSAFGRKIQGAGRIESENILPEAKTPPLASAGEVTGAVQSELDSQLAEEAKFQDFSLGQAFAIGWDSTFTATIARLMEFDTDYSWRMDEDDFKKIKSKYPTGLSEEQEQRLRNSRSQADFENNLSRIDQEIDFGKRFEQTTGLQALAGYATLFAGAVVDPAALPIGSFGVASRLVKGTSMVASAVRGGLEGAIATGLVSPVIQMADKGTVDGGELMQHMAVGALFGTGMGALSRAISGPQVDAQFKEKAEAMDAKATEAPEYVSEAVRAKESGEVIDFTERGTVEGAAGETAGAGPSAVIRSAEKWDESIDSGKTDTARKGYYNNNFRKKMMGWADSEGVKLATSESKVARYVGAMWSGDQAGVGKQFARNAAVQKELIRDELMWDTVPSLKRAYESYLGPSGAARYMTGGAAKEQATFSREVMLERARHGMFRQQNGGSSRGYVSEAPAPIQAAARVIDENFAATKKLHVESGTESAAMMKDSDPVGYIPQKANYMYLAKADPEVRKAHYSMLQETYRLEAEAKIKLMRSEKSEWMERAYERANKDMEQPWVSEFLNNPDKYFEDSMDRLATKILGEMENRASRYWDNALKDPNARFESGEGNLLQLAKELSAEHFEGRTVDSDILKTFADNLTKKWTDRSRREMNMLMNRDVNGEKVYMLDMFNHDVFQTVGNNINSTAGRVAMARLGWKTEQDIADTLQAMRHAGATPREVTAAKFVSDVIVGRAPALDDSATVRAVSNMTHAAMMGKLGMSVAADFPTMVGNLGISGFMKALGKDMGAKVIDGSMFVRNRNLTKVGSDLEYMMRGMLGHDNELWFPQGVTADGMSMELGSSLVRRSEFASRITNTMSGANAVSKMLGTAITKGTVDKLRNFLKTGRGINPKRLQDVGLHKEQLSAIQKQFDAHSTGKDFGLDKWTDPVAKQDFISAAHRFTQQSTMNRQYAGDGVMGERTNLLGVLYARFRSIGVRAQEKVLVRNLTLADSNAAAMMVTGIAWATFLAYARIHIDAATSKDPKKVLKDRLTPLGIADQAGRFASVMGLASEGTNLMQMMTGGGFKGGSDTPLTGAVSNITGAVGAVGSAITGQGDWSKAGQSTLKLLPGANTYQMMLLQRQLDD